MEGGNGVEKRTAGDEEGLDYHWAVSEVKPQKSALSS